MMTKQYPKSRQNNIVIQELVKEILIYDSNSNKAYCLNETSSLVWRMCDGHTSIQEIRNQLNRIFKTPVTEELVIYSLETLKENNLLTHTEQIPSQFVGLTRREVIRKVGFASMITLPVVSSLMVPAAIMAQSVGACGQAAQACCSSSPVCDPGLNCFESRCCIPNLSLIVCTTGAQCCDGVCCDGQCGTDCGETT